MPMRPAGRRREGHSLLGQSSQSTELKIRPMLTRIGRISMQLQYFRPCNVITSMKQQYALRKTDRYGTPISLRS